MCRKNKHFLIVFCFLLINSFFAQEINNLSQGEKLFKENKPKEAVQVLENELLNGIVSANTYNFLGLGYYQLEEYGKSIDAFNRGIKAQPTNLKILSFNQGNTYYAMKDYSSAVSCFTKSYNDDSKFYDALLNRANSLLMSDQLVAAKSDYISFIEKCPDDVQKPKIERLIQALTDEIARREEEERLLREQNKALWEEIDPAIDESIAEQTPWEKVDAEISEDNQEKKTPWENVDATIVEQKTPEKKVNWENVDDKIGEQENNTKPVNWENVDTNIGTHKEEKKKVDWEKVDNSSSAISETKKNRKDSEALDSENSLSSKENTSADWEKLDSEKIGKLDNYELYSEKTEDDSNVENWENLSNDEILEMRRLEKESRQEYEKWLEEQSLIRQRKIEEELLRMQRKADEEKLAREQLLEEVLKAEEARRKKLLDDVANSLQNGNSTNISSGTDDILEYDLEGELD